MYYQPNSCTMYHTPPECWWAGETFLRQRKKSSSSPCAAGVLSCNVMIPTSLGFNWVSISLTLRGLEEHQGGYYIHLVGFGEINKIINNTVIDVTSLLHLWSCCINHNISATQTQPILTDRQMDGRTHTHAARGLEEPFFQLCCMLCQFLVLAGHRFWFTYSCVLRVQYSCGVVLVFGCGRK